MPLVKILILYIILKLFYILTEFLIKDEEVQSAVLVACFYCGVQFRGEKGVKIHQKSCDEK